jgi:hypothetical protein
LLPGSPSSGATAIFGLGLAIAGPGIATHSTVITIGRTRTC